jgi:coenzyme F420-dependent glucose-6-phosphate dehydrogenase
VTAIGYALSSQELGPPALVRHAARAEEAGFTFLVVSDDDHPRVERQGPAPFVWGALGAIAQATERLRVGTAVTCQAAGIHQPTTIAQASATAAALMPGRFFLGLSRSEHLAEAVGAIRGTWQGAEGNRDGRDDMVDATPIHALSEPLPPIYITAGERVEAVEAARLGDGLIGTAPGASLLDAYRDAGGRGPRIGRVTVCWGRSEAEARRTAREWWPTVTLTELLPCGPDPEQHTARIGSFVEAGYDQVLVRQIGPDQAGFLKFAEGELLPALRPKALGIAS